MKGRGKREITEKTCRPAASSGTIQACENPGATPPGTQPGSPRPSLRDYLSRDIRRQTREDNEVTPQQSVEWRRGWTAGVNAWSFTRAPSGREPKAAGASLSRRPRARSISVRATPQPRLFESSSCPGGIHHEGRAALRCVTWRELREHRNLNNEVLRADEGGMKGRGKQEIPEETHRPAAWSGTIPTCENRSDPAGDRTRLVMVGGEQSNRPAPAALHMLECTVNNTPPPRTLKSFSTNKLSNKRVFNTCPLGVRFRGQFPPEAVSRRNIKGMLASRFGSGANNCPRGRYAAPRRQSGAVSPPPPPPFGNLSTTPPIIRPPPAHS
ncbi:hypothetical protein PR048_028811 [Dryococelus australis]|uniref:Uncharacterized protein n=1 Tax=Dryococelus australis TaxID=614101 RepID=A0ABQ9GEC4_9NEOP|nr:hypothetical protein PR048_028811 [Dryococelus australis]